MSQREKRKGALEKDGWFEEIEIEGEREREREKEEECGSVREDRWRKGERKRGVKDCRGRKMGLVGVVRLVFLRATYS